MQRRALPSDFAWRRGFINGPETTIWLYCGKAAVAAVGFHNDLWRTSVNRHLDIKRERSATAPSHELAMVWVERWAAAHATRIRRDLAESSQR